jgi:hypothetical protein
MNLVRISQVGSYPQALVRVLQHEMEGVLQSSNPTTTRVLWQNGVEEDIPTSQVWLDLCTPEAMRLVKKWVARQTLESPGEEEPSWERWGTTWILEGKNWTIFWGPHIRHRNIPETESPEQAISYVCLALLAQQISDCWLR